MKPICPCNDSLPRESDPGVVKVIPRTRYTFHGSTAGSPPPPSVIPLLTRVNTSEWTSGVLLVRLHAKSFPSSTSYAEVEVYNDGFTPEDPNAIFVESLLRGVITIPNGASTGTLYVVETAQPIASMMRVQLKFYQGTTTLGVSTLTISVELVGRKRRNFEDEPVSNDAIADDRIREGDEGSLIADFMALIAADYRISSACAHALNVTRGTRRGGQADSGIGARVCSRGPAPLGRKGCRKDSRDRPAAGRPKGRQ